MADGGGEEVLRRRVREGSELCAHGRDERDEERQGEKVRVEKVFAPVAAVDGVGGLDVEAHYRGEDLREEQDGQPG